MVYDVFIRLQSLFSRRRGCEVKGTLKDRWVRQVRIFKGDEYRQRYCAKVRLSMLGIGLFELVLIVIVALLVIHPQRFPGLVQRMGLLLGRCLRKGQALKREIERTVGADTIKQTLHNEALLKQWAQAESRDQQANTSPITEPDTDLPYIINDNVKPHGSPSSHAKQAE